jgi:hypothetical protein
MISQKMDASLRDSLHQQLEDAHGNDAFMQSESWKCFAQNNHND